MEIESSKEIKCPFRTQPRLAQAGSALIVAGVVLFTVAMPIHIFVLLAMDPNVLANAGWELLLVVLIIGAFLSFGSYMSHSLIRAGYEPARPKLVLLAIALVILAVQLVSTPLGFSKPLFLVEVAGIFVCIITGFLVYLVGMETGEIAVGNSVGGGLGALAGWVLGYLYCDHTLAVVACIVGGGLAAEGLGRAIRFIVRRRTKQPA